MRPRRPVHRQRGRDRSQWTSNLAGFAARDA